MSNNASTGSAAGGRTALLVGVVGLGVVLAGLGVAARPDDDPPRMEVSAGANRAVTDGADLLAAWGSPALVQSPTEPDQLVVAGRVDRPQLGAGLRRSSDGGQTWTEMTLPLPEGQVRAYAPDVAFDRQGGLYVVFSTLSDPANNPTGLWLARSADAGASFGAATAVTGPYAYQPRLAVNGPAVHVSFVQASAAVEGVHNGFGPPPNPVQMATSADSGASFAAPVAVSGTRARVGGAVPVVGSNGAVSVLYTDYGDDAVDLEGQPGGTYQGRFSLVLATSKDAGTSFSDAGVVDDGLVPGARFNPYTPPFPSLAIDTTAPGSDVMYAAWADSRDGGADVYLRRSTDQGASWSAPVKVNPDDESTDQYLPHVAVAPNGRVDVAYLDRTGDDANVLTAAALATSFDTGRTWRSIAVSDTLFDSGVGPEAVGGAGADPGSRIGLVSGADGALAVWPDTRQGNPDTGRRDLFFAPVRIVPEQ